jgi:hypothetical protein
MVQSSHTTRMAAAQTVFRVVPDTRRTDPKHGSRRLSVPAAHPNEETLDRFWRRVAELTTRYYDADHKWICGDEIRAWNSANRQVGYR